MLSLQMEKRRFGLPLEVEARLRTTLESIGYTLPDNGAKTTEAKKLADAVLRLSDHFTQNPDAATPWRETWAQAAYLAYFFTLNFARASAVATEAKRVGFLDDLTTVVDFGSGTGSAVHALSSVFEKDYIACDISAEALSFCRSLSANPNALKTEVCSSPGAAQKLAPIKNTAMMASYSLTELPAFPREWMQSEAVIIIEPSTRDDGRRLQSWRSDLIEAGFRIWAPCTHEGACPLLIHSEKDWCHDRIHFDPPKWWDALEQNLPMKNRTITYSYLLARKSAPPAWLQGKGRLIGDMLEEKGKTRQAICRGDEREFLSWFPQRLPKNESIEFERGVIV
ncbi:MAG TPA: small ribosomal subunit Rsm22 family protein, partial [Bdellovibrionales bacterium]|nr:small ribosomal subunit Rsm22 family protein [Bdellovibrionales bacterium]